MSKNVKNVSTASPLSARVLSELVKYLFKIFATSLSSVMMSSPSFRNIFCANAVLLDRKGFISLQNLLSVIFFQVIIWVEFPWVEISPFLSRCKIILGNEQFYWAAQADAMTACCDTMGTTVDQHSLLENPWHLKYVKPQT